VAVLVLAASGTALATGLGAIPVFFLGERAAQLTPLLLGFAAGVMGVASVFGLLVPAAEEGSTAAVIGGLAVGAALLGLVRRRLDPHTTFMGRGGPGARTSALVFLVLFVHSLPEGFAVGTAFASDRAGLSLFVICAIAIQKAIAEKNPIYAVIVGSGVNSDGRTPGLAMPNQAAQEALLRRVYRDAGIDPSEIAYVEAHGQELFG